MRFIGSKAMLLQDIEKVIDENTGGQEQVFCDIFSGTGVVARHFKSRYQIISNDILHFSYILQKATIENNRLPDFEKLKKIGILDPFAFLEETRITDEDLEKGRYFIACNYSPMEGSQRMYLSPANAMRIDFIRETIGSWREGNLISEEEFCYLLACLIEGVPSVSNITGTYGAYLKTWEKRSYKEFEMVRLPVIDNGRENRCFHMDANKLIGEIEGDILYMDPPYNTRQYAPNYHLLETVSRYDCPQLKGVTGMRDYSDQKSLYCMRGEVKEVFEDLVEKARFPHLILSYSTDGLMTADDIEKILRRHSLSGSVRRYDISYRKYKSKIPSKDDRLKEYIFYAAKDIPRKKYVSLQTAPGKGKKEMKKDGSGAKTGTGAGGEQRGTAKHKYMKSPLNYIGGKYRLLPQILPLFPADISMFVDLFAGGANVAVNVKAKRIVCNDINFKIIELFKTLQEKDVEDVLAQIRSRIRQYGLSKENEEGFLQFRRDYNRTGDPVDLYTLTCFSFNYQFRFNNRLEYNNPFGRNRSQFSDRMKNNLIAFMKRLKEEDIRFTSEDFVKFDLSALGPQDMLYCDPPYLITTGSYNDGNRGFKDWNQEEDRQLLSLLDEADRRGIRFALSNVLEHKGRINEELLRWSEKYCVHELNCSYSNSSYNTERGKSREVLITNYGRRETK